MAKISEQRQTRRLRGSAFAAWAIGSLCAVISHLVFPQFGEAVIGLVTAAISYTLIMKLKREVPLMTMEGKNA